MDAAARRERADERSEERCVSELASSQMNAAARRERADERSEEST
jgi:hypothetical protein